MKTLVVYVCETCGAQFEEQAKCERCEAIHKKPVRIVEGRWRSLNQDSAKFPYPGVLRVEMTDGTTQDYVMKRNSAPTAGWAHGG